jgi:hypothetical protein
MKPAGYCQLNDNFADPTTAGWVSVPPATNGSLFHRFSLKLTVPTQELRAAFKSLR